ncbi:hypothetical protein ACHAW6_000293 [Cyclotella cf. meneghiniana]
MSKKSRFDGLDVAAMTSHLRRTLLGFKLANVYDGSALLGGGDKSSGVYIFKLADPSGGSAVAVGTANEAAQSEKSTEQAQGEDPSQSKRVMLLMESGVRFHPTIYNFSPALQHQSAQNQICYSLDLRDGHYRTAFVALIEEIFFVL